MSEHNLDLMRRYLAAMQAGDFDAGTGFFADDVVVHIPGRSRFAGTYRGKQAVLDYFAAARDLVHGGTIEIDLIEMLAGPERVALVLDERFHRESGVVEIRRTNVYRIVSEQIVEVAIYEANQYEADGLME